MSAFHVFDTRRVRQATWACVVFYFGAGFAVISWMSRMPSIRDTLGVSPSAIGVVLFVGALGSLVVLPAAGPLIGAIGTRRSMRIAVSLWALGMLGATVGMLWASSWVFAACLIAVSAGQSLWGSVMNVEGGLVEVAGRRRVLPQLHALFSVGAVVGAAVTAPIAAVGLPVAWHLVGICLPLWFVVMYASRFMLSEQEAASFSEMGAKPLVGAEKRRQVRERTKRAWTERRTLMVAVVVISGGLLEGAANDWLALAMVDGYGYEEAAASLVFALFLLVMVVVRLAAPRILLRVSEVRLLRVLLLMPVAGLSLVAFSPHWSLALVGVLLWALGASLVFPLCGSALSYDPQMTAARMSVMTSIEFVAYLAAPPLLGMAAHSMGYERALVLIVPMLFVSAYLTKYLAVPRTPGGSLSE